MTKPLIGTEVAEKIEEHLPGAVVEAGENSILLNSESVLDICRFLNQTAGLDFDYLTNLTAVDYLDYFEVVYHLVSLKHNHSLVLKARCFNRENPPRPTTVIGSMSRVRTLRVSIRAVVCRQRHAA